MQNNASLVQEIDPLEIIAALREGLLVLTEDLVVEYASPRFLTTFAVDKDHTIGRPLADLGNGQWNIPALLDPLGLIVAQNKTLEDYEVDHKFEHIGRRVMRLNARKTVRHGNGSKRILLAIEDVTVAADLATDLARQKILSEGIVDTLREPLLVLDAALNIYAASRAFYAKFGVVPEDTIGRSIWDLGNGQWAAPDLTHLLQNIIPDTGRIDDFEVHHDFPNLGKRIFLLNARKIFNESNNIQMLLLAMEDITERRRLEVERAAALDKSNRLLEELNHRVMNSLSLIASIISMEGRTLDDDCRRAFARMRDRIGSVGTLYRNLSKSNSVDVVNVDEYLSAVIEDTVDSVAAAGTQIKLDLSLKPTQLSTRIAVPLGLIVNELATNSLKYAYANRRQGKLGLELTNEAGGMRITIWDDGPGIKADAQRDSGLGQKLVAAFVQQLGGQLDRNSGPEGTRHIITIPADANQT